MSAEEELEAMKKEPAYGRPIRYWMADGCTAGPVVADLLGYYEEAGFEFNGQIFGQEHVMVLTY